MEKTRQDYPDKDQLRKVKVDIPGAVAQRARVFAAKKGMRSLTEALCWLVEEYTDEVD